LREADPAQPVPLARKLGIKPYFRMLLVNSPPGFVDQLGVLPAGVQISDRPASGLDLIMLFVTRRTDLATQFPALAAQLAPAGMLWVAWPKRTASVATDLSDSVVQSTGLAGGLVDTKIASIDATWSALRFVVRLRDRPKRNAPDEK